VFEQGNASRKTLMLDPSSFIIDTSRDEELTRKLFDDLNRDILGPPGDGKIIVLDDSDDDGEAQEEKIADIESMTAPASADDAPAKVRIGNSDNQRPDQEADGGDNSGRSVGDP
jgi:tagatose-1,6-bisphosphate aldolase